MSAARSYTSTAAGSATERDRPLVIYTACYFVRSQTLPTLTAVLSSVQGLQGKVNVGLIHRVLQKLKQHCTQA